MFIFLFTEITFEIGRINLCFSFSGLFDSEYVNRLAEEPSALGWAKLARVVCVIVVRTRFLFDVLLGICENLGI